MNKNQFYILAGLISLLILLVAYGLYTRTPVGFGAGANEDIQQGETGFNEIEYLRSGEVYGQAGCRIETSTTTCSIRNASGGDVWLDQSQTQMFLSKISTSTQIVFAATSTVEGWPDYTPFQASVNGSWLPIIASSTIATNTRPVISGLQTLIQRLISANATNTLGSFVQTFEQFFARDQLTEVNAWIGTPRVAGTATSTGGILLKNNEIVNFVVQAPSNRCAAGAPNVGGTNPSYGINCHSATSSDRAIIDVVLPYYRFR